MILSRLKQVELFFFSKTTSIRGHFNTSFSCNKNVTVLIPPLPKSLVRFLKDHCHLLLLFSHDKQKWSCFWHQLNDFLLFERLEEKEESKAFSYNFQENVESIQYCLFNGWRSHHIWAWITPHILRKTTEKKMRKKVYDGSFMIRFWTSDNYYFSTV